MPKEKSISVRMYWDTRGPHSEETPGACMECKDYARQLGVDLFNEMGFEFRGEAGRESAAKAQVERGETVLNLLWLRFIEGEVFMGQIMADDPGYMVLKDSEYDRLVQDFVAFIENGFDAAQPISCLLYTSPSPRDATLSRMPSSA